MQKFLEYLKRCFKDSKKLMLRISIAIFIFLIIASFIKVNSNSDDFYIKGSLSYQEFCDEIDAGNVDYITYSKGTYLVKVYYKKGVCLDTIRYDENGEPLEPVIEDGRRVETTVWTGNDDYFKEISAKGVPLIYSKYSKSNVILGFLECIPWLLMILFMVIMIKTMIPGKRFKGVKPAISDITFDDVAGLKEEKEELLYAWKSLRDEGLHEAGAKPVKGVLLEGPPGTGKTLLAKALAGEEGINFLAYSSSSFVEMFVGLGARRIRNMIETAQKVAPCIVFLDEIDALASSRTFDSNSEKDQTLLALLEAMDGIGTDEGILFIAATNRASTLDKAIVRPGRFDKILHIDIPSSKEARLAVVNVHLKNKSLGDDVSPEIITKHCYGMSGAEIAEVLNDAVILSFRDNAKGVIYQRHLDEAVTKLFAKGIHKGKHCDSDKLRVAYHELGHAFVNAKFGKDVLKVSIQPYSSGVGGVTQVDEEEELKLKTREQIEEDIMVLYGGRAAEEVFLNSVSAGASNDILRATQIIRAMVMEYGLSYGLDGPDSGYLLNLDSLSVPMDYTQRITPISADFAIKDIDKISKDLYSKTKAYLHSLDKSTVQKIVDYLLEEEVILDFNKFMEGLNGESKTTASTETSETSRADGASDAATRG